MSLDEVPPRSAFEERNAALQIEWRKLARAATFVAVLTSPLFYVLFRDQWHWSVLGSLLGTIGAIAAFRGMIDVLAHRLIPRASLYGTDPDALLDDAVARRRLSFCATPSGFSSPSRCSSSSSAGPSRCSAAARSRISSPAFPTPSATPPSSRRRC